MAGYTPGAEGRGTCPHCERRVKVGPVRSGVRRCGKHRLPDRVAIGMADKGCPGQGEVCLEDRRKGES